MKIRELLEGKSNWEKMYRPGIDDGMSDWDWEDLHGGRRNTDGDDDEPQPALATITFKDEPGEIKGKSYDQLAIVGEYIYNRDDDLKNWFEQNYHVITTSSDPVHKKVHIYLKKKR